MRSVVQLNPGPPASIGKSGDCVIANLQLQITQLLNFSVADFAVAAVVVASFSSTPDSKYPQLGSVAADLNYCSLPDYYSAVDSVVAGFAVADSVVACR